MISKADFGPQEHAHTRKGGGICAATNRVLVITFFIFGKNALGCCVWWYTAWEAGADRSQSFKASQCNIGRLCLKNITTEKRAESLSIKFHCVPKGQDERPRPFTTYSPNTKIPEVSTRPFSSG